MGVKIEIYRAFIRIAKMTVEIDFDVHSRFITNLILISLPPNGCLSNILMRIIREGIPGPFFNFEFDNN